MEAVVARHGLLSPGELLEAVADVVFVPLRHGRIRGASHLNGVDRPLVVINASLLGRKLDGAFLHEGGHIVLHPWANRLFLQGRTLFLPGRYETEADVFALAYALKWDREGLEECGRDALRFAGMYGLPRAVPYAREAAARVLGTRRVPEIFTP